MTQSELKRVASIGAELGAAKAEVDRLRGLLTTAWRLRPDQHYHEDHLQAEQKAWEVEVAEVLNAAAVLSQQPEPTDTFTAVEMATAAAQGFRDGQAAVEQAPAQDEREASRSVEHIVRALNASVAVGSDGDWVSIRREHRDAAVRMLSDLDADFRHVYQAYAEAQKRATRPAQTEQEPAYVECRECTDCGHVGINDAHPTDATCAMCDWSGPSPVEDQCPDCGKENAMGAACPKCSGRYRILAETHVAAPIAQTALSAVTAERDRLRDAAGKAIAWLDAEQNGSGVGINRRLKLCRDAENSLREAMAAKEA